MIKAKVSGSSEIAKYIDNLTSTEEKVASILQERKEATRKELEELSGLSDSTITRSVKALIKEGLTVETNKKRNKSKILRWVGGIPALESELMGATSKHIAASILAENYDLMILNPFSIFELLFENNYWEIMMNLKEGLTDDELKTYLGNSINLDSIRRVLVTCDAHNIIKLNRLREPAINDIVKLYEPLYRIEKINKEYIEYLTIIRGLASAMSLRIEGKTNKEYSHLFDPLLEMIVPMFFSLKDKATSNTNESDNEILKNVILNYDSAPDMDRLYRPANWRKLLTQTNNIAIDEKSDIIMIRKGLSEDYKKAILGRVTKK